MYGRFNWLVRFVCTLFCCLFTVQVNAAFPAPYIKTKYGYTKKVTSNGTSYLRTEYLLSTVNIPPGSTIPANKQLTVYTPKSTVASRAKSFKRITPFDVAVAAAVAAAGYAIDELSGQITKPVNVEIPPEGYSDGQFWYAAAYSSGYYGWTPEEACVAAGATITIGTECYREIGQPKPQLFTTAQSTNCYPSIPFCDTPLPEPTFETQWHPLSVSEEDSLMENAIDRSSERQLKPLFSDPYSNPYNWPEFWDALRDWMKHVADRDPNDNVTYNPVNNTWVIQSPGSPDIEIEVNPTPDPTEPDFDPSESSEPSQEVDLPDFCDWATVVCEWLEWTKEEPDNIEPDDLPVDEIGADDIRQEYNAALGGGSCPAPVSFSYAGQTGVYDYSPACMAATDYIKPLLLLIAGVMAAFIIAGTGRSV